MSGSNVVSLARRRAQRSGGDERSDGELVTLANGGDRAAVNALYWRYRDKVGGLAYRLLGSHDGLDDVVQDTFVAAIEGMGSLRNPQAFSKWIGSITVRTARKHLRRRGWRRRFGLAGPVELDTERLVSPTAPPEVREELERLYAALERMPAEERIAFVLRRIEGYANQEIADAMGLSLATVKRRVARATERIERVGDRR